MDLQLRTPGLALTLFLLLLSCAQAQLGGQGEIEPTPAPPQEKSHEAQACPEKQSENLHRPAGWEKRKERQDKYQEKLSNNLPHVPPDLETYYELGEYWHVKPGGFVHFDFITDLGKQGDSFAFTPSQIPVGGYDVTSQDGLLRLGNSVRLGGHRTRFFSDFYWERPLFTQGTRFYFEADLNGRDGAPNLRHAFIAFPYLVVGRTDSAFKDPDAEPETVDASGPNALFGSRQQGIRLILPFNNGSYRLAVALEDAGGILTPGGDLVVDQGTRSRSNLAAHFRVNEEWGHLQLSAMNKGIVTQDLAGVRRSFSGYGAALSGQVFVESKDNLQFGVATGEGIGGLIQDLAGTQSEVGLDRFGVLDIQKAWSTYVAYQHWWDENTRSTAYVSLVDVSVRDGEPPDSYKGGQSAAINFMKNINESVLLGGELLVGRRQNFRGDSNTVGRVQFMFRYKF